MKNGIDIVEINRFKELIKNETFMKKIFTKNEIEYIKKRDYSLHTIAGLYASKEAFLKCFEKGINDYELNNIEVMHNQNNAPYIILNGKILEKLKYKNISLSISHDKDYAIASVLITF